MKNKKAAKKIASKPNTQTYLDIAEIRDEVVVLKDGTLRAVLITSSINFSLKSEDEQNGTISAYVGFLNSLDFPVQICVQSRRLQIKPYLEKLIAQEKKQTNELLRMQTAEYVQYISELVELGEIMSKRFYVVIPYIPGGDEKENFFRRLSAILSPVMSIRLHDKQFQE